MVTVSGHQDDPGTVTIRCAQLNQVGPGFAWHLKVRQDQVERRPGDRPKRLVDTRRSAALVPEPLQGVPDDHAGGWLIVDTQDHGHGVVSAERRLTEPGDSENVSSLSGGAGSRLRRAGR